MKTHVDYLYYGEFVIIVVTQNLIIVDDKNTFFF